MSELLFSKKHIWVNSEEEKVKVGITDYAQDKLGNILFINLPDCEEDVVIGNTFGDIESVKTVSDLISPVDGKVISVNEDLVDEPDIINDTPYKAWLIEVEASKKSDELMTESEYKEYLEKL